MAQPLPGAFYRCVCVCVCVRACVYFRAHGYMRVRVRCVCCVCVCVCVFASIKNCAMLAKVVMKALCSRAL